MQDGRKVLVLVLVLFSSLFFMGAQSGVPTSGAGLGGWTQESAEQAFNGTGVKPVTVSGAGFSAAAQVGRRREADRVRIEPTFKEAYLPATIGPHVVVEDKAEKLPPMRLAPPLTKNFDGVKFHDLYPSDTTLAVGPTELVVAVNSAFAIYTKTGIKRAEHSFDDWLNVLSETQGAFFFDPKLAYDQYAGHFIMVVDATRDSDSRAWYVMAVSQTSNPEGTWTLWALDQGLNGTTRTKNWVDYPAIGYDESAIYLSGNVFNFPGKFLYAKLRIVNKSEVYKFGTIHWRDFWNLRDANGQLSFTVQPARSTGTTSGESMVSLNRLQGSSITLWNVKNPTASPVITKRKINITGFQIGPDADQKGGGSFISTNDSRLSDAVWINGSIYAAHQVSKDWGSGEVSAIRYYQIRSSDGALLQDGTFGADGSYYFFPAIATDQRGNNVIVFIRSGPTEFVSVRFTGRRSTDPISILQSSAPLKTGLHNYYLNPDNGSERWGDYSGVSLDSDDSVWMYGMYAASPADVWKTRVGRTRFP
jgi:hypothetical protein